VLSRLAQIRICRVINVSVDIRGRTDYYIRQKLSDNEGNDDSFSLVYRNFGREFRHRLFFKYTVKESDIFFSDLHFNIHYVEI